MSSNDVLAIEHELIEVLNSKLWYGVRTEYRDRRLKQRIGSGAFQYIPREIFKINKHRYF